MDNELDAACAVIEKLMEPCEKCGKVAQGGRWHLPDWEIPLCGECYDDKDGLAVWFEGELKAAVQQDPEFEQMPDGKWRRISADSTKAQSI